MEPYSYVDRFYCQVIPSMLQLISHSFWARSSLEAALEHVAGAQSLKTHVRENYHYKTVYFIFSKCSTTNKSHWPPGNNFPFLNRRYLSAWGLCSKSPFVTILEVKLLLVPEVPSTLALQVRLHSTVDGGLCSFYCGLGENSEDLHGHLDALVLVPPQIRLHHARVKRKHAHTRTCNTDANDY